MSLLPWLLDWPPSRATVAVFLLVTAFSLGTIAVLGDDIDRSEAENVTVEEIDVAVALNDEVDYPEGESGTVQTCLASGTPGDSVSVLGDVVVEIPAEEGWSTGDRRLAVTVSLGHTDESTSGTVTGPGRDTHDVFWVLEDDETLAVGDTETVQVRIEEAGSTVASATETVTVRNDSRTYDC